MRKEYPYRKVLYKDNNPEGFVSFCEEFEKNHPEAQKKNILIDVDGTTIQRYLIEGERVTVYDDYDIGTVYVLSDIKIA